MVHLIQQSPVFLARVVYCHTERDLVSARTLSIRALTVVPAYGTVAKPMKNHMLLGLLQ